MTCYFLIRGVRLADVFKLIASVVFDSLPSCGQQPTRLLCPWGSLAKNTGVGCHALLQGIFLTQGSNPYLLCLLPWPVGSLALAPPGKPLYQLMYTLNSLSVSSQQKLKITTPDLVIFLNSHADVLRQTRACITSDWMHIQPAEMHPSRPPRYTRGPLMNRPT